MAGEQAAKDAAAAQIEKARPLDESHLQTLSLRFGRREVHSAGDAGGDAGDAGGDAGGGADASGGGGGGGLFFLLMWAILLAIFHSSLWDRFSWNCGVLFGMLTPVLVEGFLRWLIQRATIDIANLRIRRF